MVKHKYHIIVDQDRYPNMANYTDGALVIGITTESSSPILIIEGKGKAAEAGQLDILDLNIPGFYDLFVETGTEWVVDFIKNNPNFTEEELVKTIKAHNLPMKEKFY